MSLKDSKTCLSLLQLYYRFQACDPQSKNMQRGIATFCLENFFIKINTLDSAFLYHSFEKSQEHRFCGGITQANSQPFEQVCLKDTNLMHSFLNKKTIKKQILKWL